MIFFQKRLKAPRTTELRSAAILDPLCSGTFLTGLRSDPWKEYGAQVKESLETEVKLWFYSLHHCFIMQKNDFSS